ncbi:MAG: isoprenylcysteine carboxylmethyltransferase family protein [Acidobacteria bacterium]|nr:isoprenylcysteine carboxylmethyltransferase family protein [Acidobacteriota bacterium]
MGRIVAFLYGAISYVAFFVTFLYAIGFVENIFVPKSIDSPPPAATLTRGIIANVILLSIFAIQHSVMARPAFKKVWTKIVPRSIERSTYVLLSSGALILLFWQWRQMADPIWTVTNPALAYALLTLSFVGWGMVLVSTFLINHFDLFGLRQVYLNLKGREYQHYGFVSPFFYRLVRHPIMLGFIVAFWATPRMTFGHLLFAGVTTAYILVAIQIEEKDLVSFHGEAYEDYRKEVSMIVPIPKRKRARAD